MFSTSLVAAMITSLAASGSVAGLPAWQTDYRTALTQSAEQHKPIAVFIARGGSEKFVIDSETAKLLKQSYVCVSLDTTTETGKTMASKFGLTEGLVISDKTGSLQALRHEGAVNTTTLSTYVQQYASTPVVTTTVTNSSAPVTAPAVNPYHGYIFRTGGCPNGNCGAIRSCPNGNCR